MKPMPPRPVSKAIESRPKTDDADGHTGDIEHVIETGLPPGISVDEAKDPGAQAPRGRIVNRS